MQKNLFKSFFLVFAFFLVVFFLVNHSLKKILPENINQVQIAGQNIRVDLALTEAEQSLGLSGRNSLASNEGMLFVFDKLDKYSFWMKDMNFAIDMIWLAPSSAGSGSAKVVYIKKDAKPESYPESYGPTDAYAKYVLEVVSGFSDKNNLKVGDSVLIKYQKN